jgi:hypothetical protein
MFNLGLAWLFGLDITEFSLIAASNHESGKVSFEPLQPMML